MDSNGTRQRQLYAPIVAKSARGWSRDSKRIAFTAVFDENLDIYSVDVESTQVTRLTSSRGEDRDPSWSPDGARLAFSSTRDGNSEVYVMQADGSDLRRVTNNSAADTSPTWSPDGSAIAFVSDRDRVQDLYLVRPDGQGLTRLTVGAGLTNDLPKWAPDASRIAFQIVRGKNYDIGIVRVAERTQTDFARSSAYDGMYTWSPDSGRLVFISGRDGVDSLYSADVDGTHPLRLSATPSINPEWLINWKAR